MASAGQSVVGFGIAVLAAGRLCGFVLRRRQCAVTVVGLVALLRLVRGAGTNDGVLVIGHASVLPRSGRECARPAPFETRRLVAAPQSEPRSGGRLGRRPPSLPAASATESR